SGPCVNFYAPEFCDDGGRRGRGPRARRGPGTVRLGVLPLELDTPGARCPVDRRLLATDRCFSEPDPTALRAGPTEPRGPTPRARPLRATAAPRSTTRRRRR